WRGSAPAGPSAPAVAFTQDRGDEPEPLLVHDRGLTADVVLVELEEPVQPHVGLTLLAVPGTRTDRQPVLPFPVVGAPGGQHQPVQTVPPSADHQQRTVLALPRVLLVGDPGPHDLPRVGETVAFGRVDEGGGVAG